MSWGALNWATKQRCRTPNAKFVLVLLANYADEQHSCYPGVEKLAQQSQLGESTLHRILSGLAKDGHIRTLQRWGKRGSRRSNRYQLLVGGPDTPLPEHDDWQGEFTPKGTGGDADPDTPGAEEPSDGIPLDPRGMPEQGDHTSQSERYGEQDHSIPLDPRGSYLSNREASYKEEPPGSTHQVKTPPPPAVIDNDDAADPGRRDEGGGDSPKDANLTDVVRWFTKLRPDWKPGPIRSALLRAVQEWDLPLDRCAQVLSGVAADPETKAPGRLLAPGPWRPAANPVAAPPTPSGPRCPRHHLPAASCTPCAEEAAEREQWARTAEPLSPAAAAFLPARRREAA